MGLPTASTYKNDVYITDRVEQLEPFHHPCRVHGVMLVICLGGEMLCQVNMREYRVVSNTILSILTGDVVEILSSEGFEAYAVLVSQRYMGELEMDFRLRTRYILSVRNDALARLAHSDIDGLYHYYPLLRMNFEHIGPYSPIIVRELIGALAHMLMSLVCASHPESPHHSSDTPKKKIGYLREQKLLDSFFELLKENFRTQHTTAFYADSLSLTSKYLSTVIKDCTGYSVSDWIDEYIVREACQLLTSTDMTIQEVAYKLSFTTQSAFGKYFKKQVGVSPSLFRKA